jgi:hypothetical protein
MHIQSAYSSSSKRPASFSLVFPSLSYPHPHVHVPAAAKAHAVTGADPTISLNLLEESMHATLERDTPAVVFRSCLFSRLPFESTRRIPNNYIATKKWLHFSKSRTPGAYEASLPNCLWRRDYCWCCSRLSGSQKPSVQVWSNGEHSFHRKSISALVCFAMNWRA